MANETLHVKIAFETRVKSQLGAETAIDYDGSDFDTAAVTEWIRPRLLGYSPIGESGVQVGTRRELWTFSVDVFAKVGLAGETTHRVWELVDLLRAAFDRHNLSVLDYSDDELEEAVIYLNRGEVTPVLTVKEGRHQTMQVNITWQGVLWT